jgi:hypothetical protein
MIARLAVNHGECITAMMYTCMHACPRRPRRWSIDSVMRCRCASICNADVPPPDSILCSHTTIAASGSGQLHSQIAMHEHASHTDTSCLPTDVQFHTVTWYTQFRSVLDQVSRWVGAEVRGLHTGRVRVILNNIHRCVLPCLHLLKCVVHVGKSGRDKACVSAFRTSLSFRGLIPRITRLRDCAYGSRVLNRKRLLTPHRLAHIQH